jgi:hypothetical protein
MIVLQLQVRVGFQFLGCTVDGAEPSLVGGGTALCAVDNLGEGGRIEVEHWNYPSFAWALSVLRPPVGLFVCVDLSIPRSIHIVKSILTYIYRS